MQVDHLSFCCRRDPQPVPSQFQQNLDLRSLCHAGQCKCKCLWSLSCWLVHTYLHSFRIFKWILCDIVVDVAGQCPETDSLLFLLDHHKDMHSSDNK